MNTTVANPTPEEPRQTPERPRPVEMTTDRAIKKFLELRGKLDAKEKEHKAELAPIKLAMAIVENWLMDDLNKANVTSMRSDYGTAYKDTRSSATVENWNDFLQYVRDNEAWDLLERRVSKLVAEGVLADTQKAVPGVKHDRETILKVRRA